MTYKIRYRRRFFFRTVTVVGHGYDRDLDRLFLDLPNGCTLEIAQWSKYDCKLGLDWVAAKKQKMESQTGQPIAVNRPATA